MTTTPILLLGLDAADADVITTLIAEGRLPNLARLRETGRHGRLATPAARYAGGVWPTFYTGTDVPAHGVFHNKLWRPDAMRVEVASEDWIHSRPFWESLDPALRVCIVDVPMVLGAPRAVNGVHLGGWATHDVLSRGSWPPDLWKELARRHGAPSMPAEAFGAQTQASLASLVTELETSTRQLQDVVLDLFGRERWDVACVVFGAVHRAGHYLWDASQVGGGTGEDDPIRSGLIAVHEAVDRALGAVLDQAGDDTLVLCFAVHGMARNPGWSDLLPDLLAALEHHALDTRPRRGLLHAIKRRIPHHRVRPILTRLHPGIASRLVSLWSTRMFDWSRTRFFPMPMDHAGYLRVNLRGREREGIVAPGAEYDAVCAQLEAWMLGLRDEATGRPLTDRVERPYAEAGTTDDATADTSSDAGPPYRHLLPDLLIPWTGPSAIDTRSVISTDVPGFRYHVPDRLPSGRAGNHTGNAWLIARGPGVPAGTFDREHHIVDLVPTVRAHLGLPPDPDAEGEPIDLRGRP